MGKKRVRYRVRYHDYVNDDDDDDDDDDIYIMVECILYVTKVIIFK